MKWKIYYTDGSTYSDQDGSPFDAPALHVQVIVVEEPAVGRFLIAQRDRYWWDPERNSWFGGDTQGEFQNNLKKGPKATLYGEFVWNHEYQNCIKAALADPYLPPKSARHPEEVF